MQIQELVEAQRWAVQAFCRVDMSKLVSIVRNLHKDRQAHVTPQTPMEARCLLVWPLIYASSSVHASRGLHAFRWSCSVIIPPQVCESPLLEVDQGTVPLLTQDAAVAWCCGLHAVLASAQIDLMRRAQLQERLKLSREQKEQIVAIRRRFLETMGHVMMQRRAAQEAMQLPLPVRYENAASLMHYADALIATENSLITLCQQQKEAYRLILYGVREVRCSPLLAYACLPALHGLHSSVYRCQQENC